MSSTSLILSIVIAIAGLSGAIWSTFRAFSIAKKSTEDKIKLRNQHNSALDKGGHGKYALAK